MTAIKTVYQFERFVIFTMLSPPIHENDVSPFISISDFFLLSSVVFYACFVRLTPF